jgi:hypothetical protein
MPQARPFIPRTKSATARQIQRQRVTVPRHPQRR